MTKTTCDFCGREMEKVKEGIFLDGPLKPENNSGKLDIIHLNARGDKHYDICPDCMEKLDLMIEALQNWTPEAEEWADGQRKKSKRRKWLK